jgi:hypothetical protein
MPILREWVRRLKPLRSGGLCPPLFERAPAGRPGTVSPPGCRAQRLPDASDRRDHGRAMRVAAAGAKAPGCRAQVVWDTAGACDGARVRELVTHHWRPAHAPGSACGPVGGGAMFREVRRVERLLGAAPAPAPAAADRGPVIPLPARFVHPHYAEDPHAQHPDLRRLTRLPCGGLLPIRPDRATPARPAPPNHLECLALLLPEEIIRWGSPGRAAAGAEEPVRLEQVTGDSPVACDRARVRSWSPASGSATRISCGPGQHTSSTPITRRSPHAHRP